MNMNLQFAFDFNVLWKCMSYLLWNELNKGFSDYKLKHDRHDLQNFN